MTITCITNLDDAWAIAEPWRDMIADEPMLSPEWLLTWWKHYRSDENLKILHLQDQDGQTIGIAPLSEKNQRGSSTLQMLGSGSVCTDYTRFISDPKNGTTVASKFAEYLQKYFQKHSAFQTAEFVIEGIEVEATSSKALEVELENAGFSIWQSPLESSARLHLPSSWEEFSKQFTHSPKRKARKLLSKIDAGTLEFQSFYEHEDVVSRMSELHRLHQLRRKMLGESGCYADDRFTRFINEVVSLLARQNKVRLEWCTREGTVISAHLLFHGTSTVYMYQSGVDPSYMEFEPGHSLLLAAIRKSIEEGKLVYDFLRGEEPYKIYWGGKTVPLATLHCRPPHTLSKVAGFTHESLWQLKQNAKSLVRLFK